MALILKISMGCKTIWNRRKFRFPGGYQASVFFMWNLIRRFPRIHFWVTRSRKCSCFDWYLIDPDPINYYIGASVKKHEVESVQFDLVVNVNKNLRPVNPVTSSKLACYVTQLNSDLLNSLLNVNIKGIFKNRMTMENNLFSLKITSIYMMLCPQIVRGET